MGSLTYSPSERSKYEHIETDSSPKQGGHLSWWMDWMFLKAVNCGDSHEVLSVLFDPLSAYYCSLGWHSAPLEVMHLLHFNKKKCSDAVKCAVSSKSLCNMWAPAPKMVTFLVFLRSKLVNAQPLIWSWSLTSLLKRANDWQRGAIQLCWVSPSALCTHLSIAEVFTCLLLKMNQIDIWKRGRMEPCLSFCSNSPSYRILVFLPRRSFTSMEGYAKEKRNPEFVGSLFHPSQDILYQTIEA